MPMKPTLPLPRPLGRHDERGEHDEQDEDDGELPLEVGVGPLADGVGDGLHGARAGAGGVHLFGQPEGVPEAGQGDEDGDQQPALLPPPVGRAGEELERLPGVAAGFVRAGPEHGERADGGRQGQPREPPLLPCAGGGERLIGRHGCSEVLAGLANVTGGGVRWSQSDPAGRHGRASR
jgi:hypothetical protein